MARPERFSGSARFSLQFLPENIRAVAVIGGIGAVLMGAILYDVYWDLMLEGHPLWTTWAENIFPLSVALGAAALGWWRSRSTRSITHFDEAATGALIGAVAMVILCTLVLGGQFVLNGVRPGTTFLQLTIVGAVAGFFFGRQIGKKREALRQLRRDHDLLRRIQDVAEVGGWEYDASTDTVRGTDQLHRMLGLSEGESFGVEQGLQFYPPDKRIVIRERARRCLRQGDPFDLEMPLIRETGERRWVRIRGQRQNASLLTGTLEDITEQREVKQVLTSEQEVLRRMYRITADRERPFDEKAEDLLDLGRSYLDLPFGHITRISAETQKITHARGTHPRLSPGESCPLGESYCRKTIQQDGLLAVQNAPDEGWDGDPAYDAFGLDSYIGSEIRVDGDVYGTFCFSAEQPREEPFSEREKTFVELLTLWSSYELVQRRKTRRLKQQNQRLDRFASVVSHDLRNPLTVAMNRLQLGREALPPAAAKHETPSAREEPASPPDAGDGPSTQRSDADKHLNAIERALRRMNDIIEDMLVLTWGRRETRGDETESIGLRTVGERCWSSLCTEDASLTVKAKGEVHAHEGRLQQLLENLIRNAVEHGGPDVEITIGALKDERSQQGFFVEDNGPGIPKAEQEKILESGYSTKEAGTGLGLSIARAVADAHGWTLSVTDGQDGGGARFEIHGAEVWNQKSVSR